MTRAKRDSLLEAPPDAFLRDLAGDTLAGDTQDGLPALVESLDGVLEAVQPSAALRDRMLAGAVLSERLSRFTDAVAQLLQVGTSKAAELLARLDDPAEFSVELPGVSFCWVEGGPALANAVRGFVRVHAGLDFPEHEHFGDETVLVLQGRFVDSVTGEVFGPGDLARMPPGSSHGFHVPEGGPDLLKLAVIHKGLRAGDKRYEPR